MLVMKLQVQMKHWTLNHKNQKTCPLYTGQTEWTRLALDVSDQIQKTNVTDSFAKPMCARWYGETVRSAKSQPRDHQNQYTMSLGLSYGELYSKHVYKLEW